ncbi:MAG: cytidylate kinase-like family protein [Lachnospiraceae bacterium]|nr:cytidylate kinase-like family protein [Lachnospiraceae bacterium]
MKKNIVVAIARQYGSGGRTVGKMLAENLKIPYYDRELIAMAAEESGINEALFMKADEKIGTSESLFKKLINSVYRGELHGPGSGDFISDKNLFNYQAAVIKKLAETSSCVIVGRAADYVLRDYENAVRVFVHAPKWFLLQEAGKVQSLTGAELEKYCEKVDKFRGDYYYYYTGQDWNDARNYDLCLDSSKLGFDKCMEEIKAYIRVRFGEDVLD